MLVGFGAPLAQAHAFSFFDLFGAKTTKSSSASGASTSSASQNSQTLPFLEAATNIDPATGGGDIVMDDKALSSEVGPSGTMADIQSSDHQGSVNIYVVRAGDTIAQVAKMFGVSANTILWANNLSSGDSLHNGQVLVILPVDGVQHTVVKGETIQSIAKKYGGSVVDILEFNDITPGQSLSVGDTIIVPNGKESTSAASSSSGSSKGNSLSAVRARLIATYPTISGYYENPLPTGHRTQGIHGYNAVDIAAPKGSPVYAAADGIVIATYFQAGDPWNHGYGNYIIIQHPNNTETLYAHLSSVEVEIGAQVEQGQQIGKVGNTGHVEPAPTPSNPNAGSHLHFEVHGARNPGADGSWAK